MHPIVKQRFFLSQYHKLVKFCTFCFTNFSFLVCIQCTPIDRILSSCFTSSICPICNATMAYSRSFRDKGTAFVEVGDGEKVDDLASLKAELENKEEES